MNEIDIKNLDEIIGKYEIEGSILKLAICTGIGSSRMENIIEDIGYNIDNFGEGTKKITRVILFSMNFIALQSEDNGTRIGYYFAESFDNDQKEEIFENIKQDCANKNVSIDEID